MVVNIKMSTQFLNEKQETDAAKSLVSNGASAKNITTEDVIAQNTLVDSGFREPSLSNRITRNKPRLFVALAFVLLVFFALLAAYIKVTNSSDDSYQNKVTEIIEPTPANDSPKKREWAQEQASNLANSDLSKTNNLDELNRYYYDLFDMYLISDDIQNAILKYETEVIPKKVQLSIKHLEWLLPYISNNPASLKKAYADLIANYQQVLKDSDPADEGYINQKIEFYTKARDAIK